MSQRILTFELIHDAEMLEWSIPLKRYHLKVETFVPAIDV